MSLRGYNASLMNEPVRVSGNEIADAILARLSSRIPSTRYLLGFVAASDPAGMSFQKIKRCAAARAGIEYRISALPDSTSQDEAHAVVQAAIDDPACGGIVIQLPLGSLDARPLLDLVPARLDPDVLGAAAYTAFLAGTGPLPPAAATVSAILDTLGVKADDLTVAVIGQGALVGMPVSDWLAPRCARLMRLDVGFDEQLLADADLVISGTGSYRLHPGLLKPGAGVIDFGFQATTDGFTGDLDTAHRDELDKLAFYTPTPGGTGPVLVATLMENFLNLAVDGTGLEPVTSSV